MAHMDFDYSLQFGVAENVRSFNFISVISFMILFSDKTGLA